MVDQVVYLLCTRVWLSAVVRRVAFKNQATTLQIRPLSQIRPLLSGHLEITKNRGSLPLPLCGACPFVG